MDAIIFLTLVSDLDAQKKKNDAIFWFPAARDAFLPAAMTYKWFSFFQSPLHAELLKIAEGKPNGLSSFLSSLYGSYLISSCLFHSSQPGGIDRQRLILSIVVLFRTDTNDHDS